MERYQKFQELDTLLRHYMGYNSGLVASANQHGTSMCPVREILSGVIQELFEELYPVDNGCTEKDSDGAIIFHYDPSTCSSADCSMNPPDGQEMDDDLFDELVSETRYCPYDIVVEGLQYGLKAARKGWDNGLNMEYIVSSPMVGLVKIYHTSTMRGIDKDPPSMTKSYFKNVTHTYEPTADDLKATDWYFI